MLGAGGTCDAKILRAAGGLDAGVPLGTVLPPLGGKGVGEAAALRAQVGCIPQWESIWGGGYDRGQEASYEGTVEGPAITRPIKPLGQAAPATTSTTAPTGAPQGTPPSATGHFWTALGAMGSVELEPDFEVSAFIIRSTGGATTTGRDATSPQLFVKTCLGEGSGGGQLGGGSSRGSGGGSCGGRGGTFPPGVGGGVWRGVKRACSEG